MHLFQSSVTAPKRALKGAGNGSMFAKCGLGLVLCLWFFVSGVSAQSLPHYSDVASLSFNGEKVTLAKLGDVNGDGLIDVVGCFANADSTLELVFWLQNASHLYPSAVDLGKVSNCNSVSIGDINGDGNPDLVTGVGSDTFGRAQVYVFLGQGNGSFGAKLTVSSCSNNNGESILYGKEPAGSGIMLSQCGFFTWNGTSFAGKSPAGNYSATRNFTNLGDLQLTGNDVFSSVFGSDLAAVTSSIDYHPNNTSTGAWKVTPDAKSNLPDAWYFWGAASPMESFFNCVPVEKTASNFGCISYQQSGSQNIVSYQAMTQSTASAVKLLNGIGYAYAVLPSNSYWQQPQFSPTYPYSGTPRSLFNVFPWQIGNGNDDFAVANADGNIYAARHTGAATWAAPQLMASFPQGSFLFDTAVGGSNFPTFFIVGDVVSNPRSDVPSFGTHINVYTAPSLIQAPTITLSSSTNPSVWTQNVTLTCKVSGAGVPTGSVRISVDGNLLGSPTLSNGSASVSTNTLEIGTHPVACDYSGDASYSAVSSSLPQVVNQAGTITAIGINPDPPAVGQTTTVTGSVAPIGVATGTPTGSITVTVGGNPVVTPPVNGSGNTAGSTTFPAPGNTPIRACFDGDAHYATSCVSTTTSVQAPNTTTAVTASPNPVEHRKTVVLKAIVSSIAGVPTGTVTFTADGGNVLGSTTLNGGAGSISNSSLAIGTHTITASYTSNSYFYSSIGSTTLTVIPSTAIVTITAAQNPAYIGYTNDMTVTVTGSDAGVIPSGTVHLSSAGLNTTVTLDATGAGTFQTDYLSGGTQTIVGAYSGDSNYSPATGTLALPVMQIPTAVAVQGTPNPSIAVVNDAVLLQLLVKPTVTQITLPGSTPSANPPTGSFTVKDQATGATYNNLTIGQDGRNFLTVNGLSVGNHNFAIAYSGDSNYLPSTQNVFVQTVVAPISTVSVTNSPTNPMVAGNTATFAARVVNPLGANQTAGTVTWSVNGSPIGSAPVDATGASALTTTSLPAGAYSVVGSYGGVEPGTSAPVPVTVAGYAAALQQTSVSMSMGGTATAALTIQPIEGFNGTVALACTGLPAPGSCTVEPGSLTLGDSPATAKVVVSATSQTASVAGRGDGTYLAFCLPVFALLGLTRKRKYAGVLFMLAIGVLGLGLSGCGVVSGHGAPASLVPGSYKVNITATAGKYVQSSTLNVAIQ